MYAYKYFAKIYEEMNDIIKFAAVHQAFFLISASAPAVVCNTIATKFAWAHAETEHHK